MGNEKLLEYLGAPAETVLLEQFVANAAGSQVPLSLRRVEGVDEDVRVNESEHRYL
jgi:hypothetical protein